MAEAADRGWTQYFYGGAEGVADELRERFQERHPALKVVGVECPPYRALTDAEDAETVARMNEARPDIVWIGLGAPKQERWMADHRDRLNATILIGVGAAFDFHTGRLDRAPYWMQTLRAGVELPAVQGAAPALEALRAGHPAIPPGRPPAIRRAPSRVRR